jgi:hypothetical protein
MNNRVPCSVGKYLRSCRGGGLSNRAQLHDSTELMMAIIMIIMIIMTTRELKMSN